MSEQVKEVQPKKAISRSAEGLRESLFETLEALRNGQIGTKEAKTLASISMAIVKTVEVQLEYEQMLIRGDVSHHLANVGILASPEKLVAQGGSSISSRKGPETFAAPVLPSRRDKEAA